MTKESLDEILRQTVHDTDLKPSELPDLDIHGTNNNVINNKFEGNKRFETDKILTKTMINNYSKECLIKPNKNKNIPKSR